MGLDSLMAVEMRNWVEAQLEIELPIAALMRSSSLRELVGGVSDVVASTAQQATPHPVSNSQPTTPAEVDPLTAQQAHDLLDQLPSLGDGEVAQLLARMMRGQ
jgi:Phosphopantetheine attachment site